MDSMCAGTGVNDLQAVGTRAGGPGGQGDVDGSHGRVLGYWGGCVECTGVKNPLGPWNLDRIGADASVHYIYGLLGGMVYMGRGCYCVLGYEE